MKTNADVVQGYVSRFGYKHFSGAAQWLGMAAGRDPEAVEETAHVYAGVVGAGLIHMRVVASVKEAQSIIRWTRAQPVGAMALQKIGALPPGEEVAVDWWRDELADMMAAITPKD